MYAVQSTNNETMESTLIGQFETLAKIDVPFPMLAERLVDVASRELIESRRKDIIRLILSEGTRFPAIADFYYREVLSRVFAALQQILQRALCVGLAGGTACAVGPQTTLQNRGFVLNRGYMVQFHRSLLGFPSGVRPPCCVYHITVS